MGRGGGRSIPPIFECDWSCGNFKLGSGYQQHSDSRSSMMYGSELG
jgi:hypothetical protein